MNGLEAIVLSSEPVPGDAVVILAGEDGAIRCDHGGQIFMARWARCVVATGGLDDASKLGAAKMRGRLMSQGIAPDRIIVDTKAQNTREQAENVIALAEQNEWDTLILVASGYHQFRAFLTFLKVLQERKFDRRIRLVNAPARADWFGRPQGVVHTRFHLHSEELRKLQAYGDHVATPEEGILYLAWWSGSSEQAAA